VQSLAELLEHLHVFVNAFLLLNGENRIAIFANHDDETFAVRLRCLKERCLHVWRQDDTDGPGDGLVGGSSSSSSLLGELTHAVGAIYAKGAKGGGNLRHEDARSQVAAAYSRALCLLRRRAEEEEASSRGRSRHRHRRILFLQGQRDCARQYVAAMNATFCAQRMRVTVDACMLAAGCHSSFLHHACAATGGIYANPCEDSDNDSVGDAAVAGAAMAMHLVNIFLADATSRKFLQMPSVKASQSGNKVACFATGRLVDIGFVCSVCLAIFCEKVERCTCCGTQFEANKKTKKKRKLADQGASQPIQ